MFIDALFLLEYFFFSIPANEHKQMAFQQNITGVERINLTLSQRASHQHPRGRADMKLYWQGFMFPENHTLLLYTNFACSSLKKDELKSLFS